MIYVQFENADQLKIISVFGSPQNTDDWPNQGVVEDDDQRYLDFINPPPDYLALATADLQSRMALASFQKAAIAERVSVIQDAIDMGIANDDEIEELPARQAQLIEWKRYAILLGRVTQQEGWHETIDWPEQPATGIDL